MASTGRAPDSELFRTACRLHQAGRLAEAAQAYGALLEADPVQFDAAFLLGLIHLQCGRPQEAERTFSRAVDLDPSSSDARSAHATALQQLGRHTDAVASLDALLALKPTDAVPWCNRGNSLLALERRADAIASYDRALALKPAYAEAWHNRAVAKLMQQDYLGAVGDLERALAIKPDYPDALEHLGVAFEALGRHEEALSRYDAAAEMLPLRTELLSRRAGCLLHLGRLEDAVHAYDHAIALQASDSDTWHNRGVALSRLDRHPEAIESYDRALQLRSDFSEGWHNRGSALFAMRRHNEALASYDRALAVRSDYTPAWKSRGVVLLALQRHDEALRAFESALALRPDDAGAWEGHGNALFRLGRIEEALASYSSALHRDPNRTDALYNHATALSHLKKFGDAATDCERLLALDPAYAYARGLLVNARLHLCDWRDLDEQRTAIADGVRRGERVVQPFAQLAISSSPKEQLNCAKIFAGSNLPLSSSLWSGLRYNHRKIRVAYLSADFYEHATAYLMAGVFEHHDRTRFETYAISYGPNDNSAMRARLECAFDRFIEASGQSDAGIAEQLGNFEIDIAVDLKGYTGSARPGILALRPAPVQVHYLGYPGTMGADCVDYMIADRIVIPEAEQNFYAERIAYLPDSYQCNDRARPLPGRAPTRGETGLPETGFVFCCFNASHKILPEMFDIWMRLLEDVSGSVLWLFAENDHVIANLRREARKRGVAEGRLVFAGRIGLEDHLRRLMLADLVLDTLPYGAHTTASDALWVGVPVLTANGSAFAGRVASSLLSAAGLPELIASSLGDYEAQARRLASDPDNLARLRAKLARSRDTSPLFDTERITRHLEAAYVHMWERQQRGLSAASFSVSSAARVDST